MTKRYFELRQFLPDALENFPELQDFCLSMTDENTLKQLNECMKKFQDVTLMLQRQDLALGQVRYIFDGLVKQFPTMSEYLSATAFIVDDPFFESGLSFISYRTLIHYAYCVRSTENFSM